MLILLSSLLEHWDGLVIVVSNFCGIETLKFDDVVGILLSEEARRKSSRSTETSGSAMSVDQRRKTTNREKKKNGKSKSKSRKENSKLRPSVGGVVIRGIFRVTASRKRTKKAKEKRKIMCMSWRVTDLML